MNTSAKSAPSSTPAASDLGPLDFPPDRTTVREVAEKLNVGETLVSQWIDSGELAAIDVSSKSVKASKHHRRITVESYRAFVKRRLQ